jgi:hypothetical protein
MAGDMERPRSEGHRGDADDQHPAGEVATEGIPRKQRRRRAASRRCLPLPDGRQDPWSYPATEPVTERELESWRCAWSHRRRAGIEPMVSESDSPRAREGGIVRRRLVALTGPAQRRLRARVEAARMQRLAWLRPSPRMSSFMA